MEPEGSLPCSKYPTAEPYPEPNAFNPHPKIEFLIAKKGLRS
jgi:hypothetical protein